VARSLTIAAVNRRNCSGFCSMTFVVAALTFSTTLALSKNVL
jgi:hypothetical protein